ncbi:LA_2272 family surface repeat-containing protein [Echinicola vietnamensis]|uniref:Uncharacterized protein n=1 Tax=Echinicola vietnamensis (strain DSM 17526 / LMG 23754 / KMM 6221) TaxID=926556 RepID=L0G0Z1_ECHVK|nr:hypothetical protein [Echinicola vietnamensis]AGA79874.1 hypothetical protein Echvi_3659 [Echinicola vietnamensis DSM 17526]
MKIFRIIFISVLVLSAPLVYAQNDSTPIYTVMYNQAPEGFNYPLIGFVNQANGNHKGAQIGFINTNTLGFTGAQIGFVNTIGDFQNGLQLGFVNTTDGPVNGLQAGFINTSTDSVNGTQLGFINTQVHASTGLQAGFINTSTGKLNGAQVGFVNINPKEVTGAQIGFVNSTGKLGTLQLGFVNYADSLEKGGFPLGFLSVVRKGGYQAVEVGYNELFPYNVSVKIGIPAFYTSFNGAYNPDFNDEFAVGAGFGSLISLGPVFFINPEAYYLYQIHAENSITRASLNFGVTLGERVQLLAGPSAAWIWYAHDYDVIDPAFSFYRERFDENDELVIGLNAALRIKLSK